MVISVDADTTVVLSGDPNEAECNVCSVGGSSPTCSPTGMTLSKGQTTTLEFSCPKPQDVFSVKMEKKIGEDDVQRVKIVFMYLHHFGLAILNVDEAYNHLNLDFCILFRQWDSKISEINASNSIISHFLYPGCTQSSCTPSTGEADPNLLKEFKRSITWDISVPERTVLALDFPGVGLREIFGSDKCQDGHQYSLSTTNSEGEVKSKRYCMSGPVAHLDLLGMMTVTAEVPKDGDLGSTVFTVKASPRSKYIFLDTSYERKRDI